MNTRIILFALLITIIAVIGGYFLLNKTEEADEIKQILESDSFEFNGVELRWMVIGGVKIKKGDTVIYVDPKDINRKNYEMLEPADYIIITHEHTPHYSPIDMYYLSHDETIWITPPSISITRQNQERVSPGDSLSYNDVKFEFTPSYNVDKKRPTGELFHPPEDLNIGVIIDFSGTRIYHAGDTDVIPEMKDIKADIAFLPVSGYAWMTANEAIQAVELLKMSGELDYVIPIHYGYNQGTDTDALLFSRNVNCSVVLLPRLFEKR